MPVGRGDLMQLHRDDCLLAPFSCCLDFLTRHVPHLALTIMDEGACILFGDEKLQLHLDREISTYLSLATCLPVSGGRGDEMELLTHHTFLIRKS